MVLLVPLVVSLQPASHPRMSPAPAGVVTVCRFKLLVGLLLVDKDHAQCASGPGFRMALGSFKFTIRI